ncbi:MAG: lactate utilization protein [Bacteroidales bacterium]
MNQTVNNLEKHGFQVISAKDKAQAEEILHKLFNSFLTKYQAEQLQQKPVVSYGDSLTLYQINNYTAGNKGILDYLRQHPDIQFLDGFQKEDDRETKLEIRRKAVLSDFYITGVNAISSSGALYWVDMVGNRVASVSIGAKEVVIVSGINKIVPTESDMHNRVRTIAAPLNIARHPGFRTPCAKTGFCMDCSSPDRICNVRLTMDRCYPAGRITVVLIEENLGL